MKLFATVIATLSVAPALAWAAAPTPHVRGTVVAIAGDAVTIHPDSGPDATVHLTDTTRYVQMRKASLDQIGKNTFIGTAAKDVGSRLVALEVVVFPESMRGAGEGHYDWDALPDNTVAGHSTVASTMTNGTVAAASVPAGRVNTTMTNGTVATGTDSHGTKMLTVTYKGGQQQILVPPTAVIVSPTIGTRADLTKGAQVVVTEAKDSDAAVAINIGMDGLKPPM